MLSCTPAARAADIAVLISSDSVRPDGILKGLSSELTPEHVLRQYPLAGDEAQMRAGAEKALASTPAVVVTVGGQATLLARDHIRDYPVVYTLAVDNPALQFHTANMTGVNADIPAAKRLSLLRELYPGLKRIGVVYNPSNSAFLVNESRQAANALGLEVVAAKVDVKQDVPRAVGGLRGQVDLLWMVQDPLLLDPDGLREILKFSLVESVPLLTFSTSIVQAGAFFAITPSEQSMGRQAGRIARQILSGRRPGQIDAQYPDDYELALNLRTAKRINRLEDLAINVLIYAAQHKQAIEVFR